MVRDPYRNIIDDNLNDFYPDINVTIGKMEIKMKQRIINAMVETKIIKFTDLNYTEALTDKGHSYDTESRNPLCAHCQQSIYLTAFSDLTCPEWIIKEIIE